MRGRGVSSPRREGPSTVFFSHAFRPFFLAAGAYAALSLAAWLAWIGIHAAGAAPAFMSIAEPPYLWHAHEMIFGFGAAAAGGFLLTAIPNWTGAPHSRGAPLVLMFTLWLAGRLAMWFTAHLPTGMPLLLDLSFLPVLGFAAARQLAVKPSTRNAVFLTLVALFASANLLFHLGRLGLADTGMLVGVRLGLATLVLMMTVIGGRVIPGFTTNALRRKGEFDRLPRSLAPLNMASIASGALALACLVFEAPNAVTGPLALLAALANGFRLALWRGWAMWSEPIVWVLHLGYGWIVIGYAFLAAAALTGIGSAYAAQHALGTGAAGTMILAIMTRAALGHTGRPLIAPGPVVAAYLLVTLAASLRCLGPLLAPGLYNEVMLTAGLAWIVAFVLFTVVYTPILLRPRVRPAS